MKKILLIVLLYTSSSIACSLDIDSKEYTLNFIKAVLEKLPKNADILSIDMSENNPKNGYFPIYKVVYKNSVTNATMQIAWFDTMLSPFCTYEVEQIDNKVSN